MTDSSFGRDGSTAVPWVHRQQPWTRQMPNYLECNSGSPTGRGWRAPPTYLKSDAIQKSSILNNILQLLCPKILARVHYPERESGDPWGRDGISCVSGIKSWVCTDSGHIQQNFFAHPTPLAQVIPSLFSRGVIPSCTAPARAHYSSSSSFKFQPSDDTLESHSGYLNQLYIIPSPSIGAMKLPFM